MISTKNPPIHATTARHRCNGSGILKGSLISDAPVVVRLDSISKYPCIGPIEGIRDENGIARKTGSSVYTKKIVGYQVSDHMRATANMQALNMALRNEKPPNIHHSDRGSQYVYKQYIDLLKRKGCKISMGLSAQDNAYAERINRTIKEEYLDYWKPKNFQQLKKQMSKAVNYYNNKRPHNNIGKLSPVEFENKWFNNQLDFNNDFTIFDNE